MSRVPDPSRVAPSSMRSRTVRWLLLVALSLLVHLVFFDTLPHWTVEADADRSIGEPLRATLAPLVPPASVPAVPATAPPRSSTAKPPAAPRARPNVPPAAKVVVAEAGRPAPDVPDARTGPDAAPTATPEPAAVPPVMPTGPPAPATTPPQSARLDYRVISANIKESNPIYGKGTITWSIADGRYASDLTAAADVFVFKVDVLSSHSEGTVGAGGLAPDRYVESPRRRATVATNFNRDARQTITFSASTQSMPLMPGAQDRLSVLFQIGALLLGDPAKLAVGTTLDIPVAGVRGDVESWRFDVRGNESIETGVGSLSTTHMQRTPRPGTNDRTIDVWVAQSDGGYPARVLYTEPNGSTVTMTLEKISAMP